MEGGSSGGGDDGSPPAQLHLRTPAVKLDSNCINGRYAFQWDFYNLSLSVDFTDFKGQKAGGGYGGGGGGGGRGEERRGEREG